MMDIERLVVTAFAYWPHALVIGGLSLMAWLAFR